MTAEPLPLEAGPELTPGALKTVKSRTLPGGWRIDFEFSPAGWLKPDGTARVVDHRAYYLTPAGICQACDGSGRVPSDKRPGGTVKCQPCKGSGQPRRERVESVTTICDRILPKDGLPHWSERAGIHGAVEAVRRGLITPETTDQEAVELVRSNKLGAEAERDRAADRGLNVHSILEEYMAFGISPNPANYPEPHRPFIRGLVKWLLRADPEPQAVEFLIADPERGYAGRADLIARVNGTLTLIDLKTQENGAIYESAHVQARLYRDAEERYGEHQIDHGLVVVVDAQGGFREMELLADGELSQHALEFYRRIKPLSAGCDSQNRIIRSALEAAA